MIKGETRDMWWLLAAYYIKRFNENSPPKGYRHDKRRERDMRWLYTQHNTI